MTVNATFHLVQGADWRWRIVITGVFKVFVPDRPRFTVVHRTDPVRLLSDLRAALLDTWNSSSESVVVRGERYLVHFELRAIPGGHEDHIQRLVSAFDAGGEGPKLQLHHACLRLGWNMVVGFHDSGEHVISGRVPPAPPFHRGRARHVHQPWSNVVLLAHDCSRYTIGHEIGHVLGLGEGTETTCATWSAMDIRSLPTWTGERSPRPRALRWHWPATQAATRTTIS